MGFFGGNNNTANIEGLLNDNSLNIYENMSIMEATYAYAAENEMNWNAIMEAVAVAEINAATNGDIEFDVVQEAGFGASILNFFKKIWEKIKSLFKKFMVMIGSLVGKDKDFAKKHGDTIRKAINNIPNDAEIKGYKFTTEPVSRVCDGLADMLNSICTEVVNTYEEPSNSLDKSRAAGQVTRLSLKGLKINVDDDMSDIMDNIRGTFFGQGSLTDAEMRDEAFKLARNNEDSPIDLKLDGSLVAKALADLDGGDKAKREANKLYSNLEKKWKASLKALENIEKGMYTAKSDDTDPTGKKVGQIQRNSKYVSKFVQVAKGVAGIIHTLCGVYLQAVKDEYSQCRKICAKVVTYKAAKEGASVFNAGYFAELNLI